MLSRRSLLGGALAAPLSTLAQVPSTTVTQIDIFHHSHNDVGYTDIPSLCRELQVRFLEAALDACLNKPSFRWTAESLMVVDDFWNQASPARRDQLLAVVARGQMDVAALPLNQTPFLDARQWRHLMEWIPESLWKRLNPRIAMQSDVNGFPRAGAVHLLNRGVGRMMMGINADSGGPPFFRPSAFWWRMPDGRKMFVWSGYHYGIAHSFFEAKGWQGRQPKAASTMAHPPRQGNFLRTDAASLAAAREQLMKTLGKLDAQGYSLPRLIISYTGQWRYDNDAPFPALADFVDAWNKAGLTPRLRLTTVTQALSDMERIAGPTARTLAGEWTDWWANGDASGPREVAASRAAKRSLEAAWSPLWGAMSPNGNRKSREILADLCLFDEHTWGANESISRPDSLNTLAQYTEKSLTAYRPMAQAEFLLGQRVNTAMAAREPGLYVANVTRTPFTGWVNIEFDALRGEYKGVRDASGDLAAIEKLPAPMARFWASNLAPGSITRFEPVMASASVRQPERLPDIALDPRGWPVSAQWPGMQRPLFADSVGDFTAVVLEPPANRRTITSLHANPDAAGRARIRQKALRRVPATPAVATRRDTGPTILFTQPMAHPRLSGAVREVELWKAEPRARVAVRFQRLSSTAPEVFYIGFGLPALGLLPVFSCGGLPFTPYTDQLEGSCRDYFGIDGWAHYAAPDGNWVWVTKDAPLVAVGGPHTLERHTEPPANPHQLAAMVFDNCWHTNFVADSHGAMEFNFELAWRDKLANPAELAATLAIGPIAYWNPGGKSTRELDDRVFRP